MLGVAQRGGAKLVKELCAHSKRRRWATTRAVRARWRVLDLADKPASAAPSNGLAATESMHSGHDDDNAPPLLMRCLTLDGELW